MSSVKSICAEVAWKYFLDHFELTPIKPETMLAFAGLEEGDLEDYQFFCCRSDCDLISDTHLYIAVHKATEEVLADLYSVPAVTNPPCELANEYSYISSQLLVISKCIMDDGTSSAKGGMIRLEERLDGLPLEPLMKSHTLERMDEAHVRLNSGFKRGGWEHAEIADIPWHLHKEFEQLAGRKTGAPIYGY